MKKPLFALLALLLASFLVTCDLLEPFPDTDDTPPGSTGDGMARLAIKVGDTNRALTIERAKLDVDYYEVVFKKESSYYQTAWAKSSGTGGTITIPTGNYANAEDAVVFAGKRVEIGNDEYDYILLAVGVISSTVTGGNTFGNAVIKFNTTSVTFTLTPLKNDVSDVNVDYTFKITGPTYYGDQHWNYATKGTYKQNGFPVFPIPGVASGFASGYQNPGTTAGDIAAGYGVDVPHNAAVILQAAWSANPATLIEWPGSQATGTVSYNETAKTLGIALDATCTFDFKIDVSAVTDNGLCAVLIDAPVRALSSTVDSYVNPEAKGPILWHIRGGTDKTAADNGTGNGAAVVLAVGEHPYTP
jgi:hypothetical protein